MDLDVVVVAGRRPALLARTLSSFNENLLSNFRINRVFVNIDPIFGTIEDHLATEQVVKSFFPEADISAPETPGFCAAVKNLWLRTQSRYVLHMEDDWVVNTRIGPEQIFPAFKGKTKQVTLNAKEKHWNTRRRGVLHWKKRYYRIFGREIPLRYYLPAFSTSPSFIDGDFARSAGSLLDVNFDPEKQFWGGVNPELEAFVRPYRVHVVGDGPVFPISDIGREWRDARGITKSFVKLRSVWDSPT